VRRIFSLTLDGMGTDQIAALLSDEKLLTPFFYWEKRGRKLPGRQPERDPCQWNNSTVIKILTTQEYCGDVINFKTYTKSYKNKKCIANDPENWAIFKDVHEAVIDRATWEKVQQKRGKIRKRTTHTGERNMFSGLLVCSDCGINMNFHFNQKNHEIQYFNCPNNNRIRKLCATTHYVRVDFLEQVVLGEVRRLTKFASQHESSFVEAVMGHSQQTVTDKRQAKQKEINALLARDKELDTLFERMYEDNVAGKITDDRFAKMSQKYEAEQAGIAEQIKLLREELAKVSDQSMTTEMFIATVRKYTRAKKLAPRMLNELIDRIEVFQAEKIDGIWQQRLRIHYNCVGALSIPEQPTLPKPAVQIQTRRGVQVSYTPADTASADEAA
ncbi:MAG: DUF4368 domain-containing protein, partial [Clostridia bacterium]|nr:DUF4368 domain-containing protein [Clostridia bacterium]